MSSKQTGTTAAASHAADAGLTDMRVDDARKAIALTVLGSGCIVLNDAAMKWVITDHPIGEAIFVRGVFALLPIWLLVRRAGGAGALRWRSARAHALCAVLLVIPLFAFVYSLANLPLSMATLIFFTNPLFVTVLAPWILDEKVGWRRRAAVLVGFAGATIVIQPAGTDFRWVMLAPVFVAFMVALRDLLIRRLVRYETSVSLLMSTSAAVTLTALATAPLGWTPLALLDVALLALAGICFGFGIYFMTDALRYADASLTALYKYSAVVWALLLGFMVWGETPGGGTWAGAVLIVTSGLYILYRERRRAA